MTYLIRQAIPNMGFMVPIRAHRERETPPKSQVFGGEVSITKQRKAAGRGNERA